MMWCEYLADTDSSLLKVLGVDGDESEPEPKRAWLDSVIAFPPTLLPRNSGHSIVVVCVEREMVGRYS